MRRPGTRRSSRQAAWAPSGAPSAAKQQALHRAPLLPPLACDDAAGGGRGRAGSWQRRTAGPVALHGRPQPRVPCRRLEVTPRRQQEPAGSGGGRGRPGVRRPPGLRIETVDHVVRLVEPPEQDQRLDQVAVEAQPVRRRPEQGHELRRARFCNLDGSEKWLGVPYRNSCATRTYPHGYHAGVDWPRVGSRESGQRCRFRRSRSASGTTAIVTWIRFG